MDNMAAKSKSKGKSKKVKSRTGKGNSTVTGIRSTVKKVVESKEDTLITPKGKFGKNKKVLAILLVAVVALLYYFRSTFVVALVNNRPIFRTTVLNELEKQGGAQVLESLVTRLLITQEAGKAGITVAQSEIDAEIDKLTESISAQGQTLDQFLAFQGLTKEDLETNIEIQKLAEGLLADKIVVSAQEVASYIEENAGVLPPDLGEEQIREQLKQQKLSTEFQAFITNLQESSDIKYIREY